MDRKGRRYLRTKTLCAGKSIQNLGKERSQKENVKKWAMEEPGNKWNLDYFMC